MRRRLSEVDWLKGLAILGVMLIHARPLADTWAFDHVINRSVSVFLVLFGFNAGLWWASQQDESWAATSRRWYVARLPRLLVPVWVAFALWWCLAWVYGEVGPPSAGDLVSILLGQLPELGMAWFVTLVLELVVLLPLLQWLIERLGNALFLLSCLVATGLSSYDPVPAIEIMGAVMRGSDPVLAFMMFPPVHFWAVGAGLAAARIGGGLPSTAAGTAALVIFACGSVVASGPSVRADTLRVLTLALDVPLTFALLMLVSHLRIAPLLVRALTWCGLRTWELYLGQLLVHEAVRLAYPAMAEATMVVRWMCFGALLGGGCILVAAGSALSAAVRSAFAAREGSRGS